MRLFALAVQIAVCMGAFTQSCSAVHAAEPQYTIRFGEPKPMTATLSFDVNVPAMEVKQWTFFAAAAPELPWQTKAKTTADPRGALADDLRLRDRKLMLVRVAGGDTQHRAKITITYQASLSPRTLVHRLAAKPPAAPAPAAKAPAPTKANLAKPPSVVLTPNERKAYLSATVWSNFDDATFKDLLDANSLRRGEDESEIAFARRAFAFAKARGKYSLKPGEDKSAAAVTKTYRTDCCGWSNWFVAVLRASDIPARAMIGRWARSADEGSRLDGQAYAQEHVRAEFFVEGIGWVPVDLSQAVQHDSGRENWRYFGQDRGDFFTMHVDTDFEIITKETGKKHFLALQLPSWQVTGKGEIKGWTGSHTWRVEQPIATIAEEAKPGPGNTAKRPAKSAPAKNTAPARTPPPSADTQLD